MSTISPSSNRLPTITVQKLRGLCQRRWQLLLARGVAITAACFLVVLLLGAFVDIGWNISEETRWSLSFMIYGVAAVAALIGFYPCAKPWGMPEAAKTIETEVPEFRNYLLSAVELSVDSDDPRFGSRGLRDRLQENVAGRIEGLRIGKVLPWSRIRHATIAALAVLVLLGMLSAIPSLHLPQHMLRLLLPYANLARPNIATIHVAHPNPASQTVAINERLAFEAHLLFENESLRREPRYVQIEYRVDGEKGEKLFAEMVRPSAVNQDKKLMSYVTSLDIQAPRIEYRITSDIGESVWHELRAHPRPAVKSFEIEVNHPEYAAVAPSTSQSTNADVEVIKGSIVEWKLQSTEKLTSAKLRWLDMEAKDGLQSEIPCQLQDDGSWSVKLDATESRRFQFDLVSEVGLTSTFPTTYRLTVRDDMTPRVAWVQPTELSRVIRPRSAAELIAQYTDEYPLKSLVQLTRINSRQWYEKSLTVTDAAEGNVEWIWELAGLRLRVGDVVETKLIALDRKGQTAESPVIQWIISGTELDARRDTSTMARQEVADRLKALAQQALSAQNTFKETTDTWRKDTENSGREQEVVDTGKRFIAELNGEVEKIRSLFELANRTLSNPLSLEEMVLTVDMLARLETESEVAETTIDRNREQQRLEKGNSKNATEQFQQRFEQYVQGLQRVHENYRRLIAVDVLADLSRDLIDTAMYQEELLRDEKQVGSSIWNQEEKVLVEHLRALATEMLGQSAYLPDGPANGLREWANWAEQLSERIADLTQLEKPSNEQVTQARINEVRSILNELRYHRSAMQLHGGAANEAVSAKRELYNNSGRHAEIIQRALRDWQGLRSQMTDPTEVPESFTLTNRQYDYRRDIRLTAGVESSKLAADLGMASRAIPYQIELAARDTKKSDEIMQVIASAVSVIEAGYRLDLAAKLLTSLQETERFAAASTVARTDNPALWDAWSQEMEMSSELMRNAKLPTEIADAVNALRWSTEAQQAGQKIGNRRWEMDKAVSASSDIDTLQARLQSEIEKVAPLVADARDRLRQLAPTVTELAQEAAELAQKEQEETEALQADLAAGEVPNVAEKIAENQANNQQKEELAETLKEALVDLAASQNVLDKQQLETAQAADMARELQQQAEQRIEQATAEAKQAEAPKSAESLEKLRAAQERETDVLKAIAEHFGKDPLDMNPSESLEESRLAELAAQENSPTLDQAYNEAERLADLAAADPRELLRSLEKELARNEEMQEELSDIAQNLAEQTQDSLENAAQREQAIRSSVQQSDGQREPKRQEFVQELNNALEQASRIAQRIGSDAQSQAGLGKQEEQKKQLQQTAEQLQKSVQQAREAAATGMNEDLRAATQQLAESMKSVQPQLQATAQQLGSEKGERQFEDNNQQQQARSSAEKTQNQLYEQDVRAADQAIRQREQRSQAAERNVKQAEQQLAQAEKSRNAAGEQAQKNPANEYQQKVLAEAEALVSERQSLKQVADELKQKADSRLNEARQDRQELGNKPSPLEAGSPNTELAERLTQQAAARADELGKSLQQMMDEAGWMEQLQASRANLDANSSQQENLQEAVQDAARDLERAAAHQERLGAQNSAKALSEAAQKIDSTARQEVQAAGEQLEQGSQAEGKSNARQASAEETRNANNALANAKNALQSRANEVSDLLEASEAAAQANADANQNQDGSQPPPDANGNPSANSNAENASGDNNADQNAMPSQGENSNSGDSTQGPENGSDAPLLSPRELAEMLDELDRQLRDPAGAIEPDSNASQQASQNAQELSAMRRAQQQVAQKLQQSRPSNAQNLQKPMMVQSREPSSAKISQGILIPNPQGSGASRAFATDEIANEPIGAWSRLREKKSEEVVESQREAVAPRYRKQIENYFKVLSERDK